MWQVSKWDSHVCVTRSYSNIIIVILVLKQLCADLTVTVTKITQNCTHWVIFTFICWAEYKIIFENTLKPTDTVMYLLGGSTPVYKYFLPMFTLKKRFINCKLLNKLCSWIPYFTICLKRLHLWQAVQTGLSFTFPLFPSPSSHELTQNPLSLCKATIPNVMLHVTLISMDTKKWHPE